MGVIMKIYLKNFLLCGFIGWCTECFWTGLGSVQEHSDRRLLCRTSLWMFPIYGMAAVIPKIAEKLKGKNFLIRGTVYMTGIFVVEFFTGTFLQYIRSCPWDYSKARLNIRGVIRLDYAPVWFVLGLIYERILCTRSNENE